MNLRASIIALAGLGLLVCPCSIRAVQFGQIDDFQNGTTQDWQNGGGGPPVLNLDGGPAGPGDLFMRISSIGGGGSGGRLTVFNRLQWLGDYIGEGITVIEVDLNNSGSTQLSIRIAFKQEVGRSGPGYVSQPFVIPAGSGWQHATFSITPGTMIPINGPLAFSTFFSGNFEEARIINSVNPDLNGDPIVAELGIDNIHATATVNISGTVTYCVGTLRPVPGVTLGLTGDASNCTLTDGSGAYLLSALPGGNYTVTPSLAYLPSGLDTHGINTNEAVRIAQHGSNPLTGCALLAARTNANNVGTDPNASDALFVQQYVLNLTLPSANRTGQSRFVPESIPYMPLTMSQGGQDYDAYVIGDPLGNVVFPTPTPPCAITADAAATGGTTTKPNTVHYPRGLEPIAIAKVALPVEKLARADRDFILPVTVSKIDPAIHGNLQAFQGDFTYDASVISFRSHPVTPGAVMTNNGGSWALLANPNLTNTTGPIRTCRVVAFCLNNVEMSTEGTRSDVLFSLNLVRLSTKAGANTSLVWSAPTNHFRFFDTDGFERSPANAPSGKLSVQNSRNR